MMLRRGIPTQRDLSRMSGIDESTISHLATGRQVGIRFQTLERLCVAFECEPGDLLGQDPITRSKESTT